MIDYLPLIICSFLFGLSGCVGISAYSKEQSLTLIWEASSILRKAESKVPSIFIDAYCNQEHKAVSMMISPVIPLPPIVPVNDGLDYVSVTLSVNLQEYVPEKLLVKEASGRLIWESTEIERSVSLDIDVSCSELDDGELVLFLKDEKNNQIINLTYRFEYSEGDGVFDFGFLGA